MPREVMDRRAADNVYLHRDFHGALSNALIYLEERFGPEAVRDYLRQFALRFYAPLRAEIARQGLPAIAEHLRRIYAEEGAEVHLELNDDALTVRVDACPAVTYMRAHGHRVSPLWRETTATVYRAICAGTDYDFELLEYDDETGASVGRFSRRQEGRA